MINRDFEKDDELEFCTFEIGENLAGKRADAALSELCSAEGLTLTRSALQKLIDSGNATLGQKVLAKSSKLKEGDVVTLTLPPVKEYEVKSENIPLDIIYEDSDIIIVNKPCGMVVHPAPGHTEGTLVSALLYHCGDSLSGIGGVLRPGIVHRIDRDTTGLICAAKNDAAHISLSEQLKTHAMHRTYRALCIGRLAEKEGRVEAPIGRHKTDRKRMAVTSDGRFAATNYRVIEEYFVEGGAVSYLELELETGRTHQIRVHMAHIGHPLLGDTVYGGGVTRFERNHPKYFCGQALHAVALTLSHPRTGEIMRFESPLDEKFSSALELIEKLNYK